MRYKQTFENFVVAATNEIPVAVARSILTKDGPDRILIYGPSGSGKTHLLQALFYAAKSAWPGVACDTFTGHTLVEQYVRSIQENQAFKFVDHKRSLDLLLLDDISLLERKTETIRFLESILTKTDGPRIVATSSINLDSAHGFTEKFVHEISRGVTVQLTEPDKETARGVVIDRADQAGLNMTEEAITAIIETVGANGHKLIGAIETLRAHALSQRVEIGEELVRRLLTIDI
jgi:chromosomal replication initiator protein